MIPRILLTLLAIPTVFIVANVLAGLLVVCLLVSCIFSMWSGEEWP